MAARNIVVIGGSAGGLEALLKLAGALPRDLEASLFVVLHTSNVGEGLLPQILRRAGAPAVTVERRETIRPKRVYVAPGDRHLLLERGYVKVTGGPKENGFRPAVDPLFRTAAAAYGPRVIGVVLSGGLDDGTRGLLAIKRAGGIAVVQDPADALVNGMPRSALDNVQVDHGVPAAKLGALLARLVQVEVAEDRSMARKKPKPDPAERGTQALKRGDLEGSPSNYVCPECGGSLRELRDGKLLSFRCHVGHAYTADGLVARHTEKLDAALWTALRTLEDSAALRRHMAENMRDRGLKHVAKKYDDQAEQIEARADVIRRVVAEAEPGLPATEPAERETASAGVRPAGKGNGRRGGNGEATVHED